MHRRGKFRMAVVEIYTGFESFLIDFVRKKYDEKKYEENLINHLMNRTNLNFMLTKGLKLSLGKKFVEIDDVQWNKWLKVQELRRDIIHHNRTKVFQKESENAIKVVNEMIKKIIDEG